MGYGIQSLGDPHSIPYHQTNPAMEQTQQNQEPVFNMPNDITAHSPQEIINRKTMALARLSRIESIIVGSRNPDIGLIDHFECPANILNITPDVFLNKYQTDQTPPKLCDFTDWACAPIENRIRFQEVIAKYDVEFPPNKQYTAIKNLLKNCATYFDQQSHFNHSEDANKILKTQFREIYGTILDGSENCIEQFRQQLEHAVLNVLASGISPIPSSEAICLQTGLVLHSYRRELFDTILIRDRFYETQIAELRQSTAQSIAGALNIELPDFKPESHTINFNLSFKERLENAIHTFNREYKPELFLLESLKSHSDHTSQLRNSIMKWAHQYYDLSNEDPRSPNHQSHDMDWRISESEESIKELSAGEGGKLSLAAIVLFLEQLGILTEVTPYILRNGLDFVI